MKNKIITYLIVLLVTNITLFRAMDKPAESKGIFSKIKAAFKLTPEEATQKLRSLIDAKSENIELKKVTTLVAAGADKEVKNEQGKTILQHAVEANIAPVVTFLLQNGANPKEGALVAKAAFNRNINITKALIAAGADVNEKDEHGLTALYYAVDDVKPEVVRMLLSAGANPNVQTRSGNTPLHVIMQKPDHRSLYPPEKRDEIVSLLLQQGADVTIANAGGQTPAMLLKGTKHEAYIRVPRKIELDETSRKLLEEMKKGKGRK